MSKNVSQILKFLSLADENVISIYLVGSRLWGTHTERSDFDILIIIEDPPIPILKSRHKNQYDITLLTKSEFIKRIKQGSFIEIVCCLIDREDEVWKRGEQMKHLLPAVDTLEAWVAERNTVDYEKAMKFWIKGKQEEASKILQHIFTATIVTKELKRRANIVGHLCQVTLSLQDLRALVVVNGRGSDDTPWLNLPWSEVETAHKAQVRRVDPQ